MAKRRKRIAHTNATKREAAQAVINGESATLVAERYNIVPSLLYNWRKKYERGEFGDSKAAKGAAPGKRGAAKGAAPGKRGKVSAAPPDEIEARRLTPEALFTSRVNRAIVLLRQAWNEVRRMERERKIKGPDKAHSLAYVALLELQGDNGE